MHSWGCYLAIQPPLKSLPGTCDVTSFSPCTDSSHELRDLQHFMSEQIDLHIFKAFTAAFCVDIIVNKQAPKQVQLNQLLHNSYRQYNY